ncbi:hypothetical protein Q5P01_011265 [Channa striata]|uniref:Ephrin-A1 n=1 Tax=Channa striata TaxID=64152 RepID=A0AA88MTI0_CHASR|nr:hypothetical protein Q5P01_011265 [Channa striata]
MLRGSAVNSEVHYERSSSPRAKNHAALTFNAHQATAGKNVSTEDFFLFGESVQIGDHLYADEWGIHAFVVPEKEQLDQVCRYNQRAKDPQGARDKGTEGSRVTSCPCVDETMPSVNKPKLAVMTEVGRTKAPFPILCGRLARRHGTGHELLRPRLKGTSSADDVIKNQEKENQAMQDTVTPGDKSLENKQISLCLLKETLVFPECEYLCGSVWAGGGLSVILRLIRDFYWQQHCHMRLQRRPGADGERLEWTRFPWRRAAMDLVCVVCLALSIGALFASAERHSVYWNSSNPNFLWDEYTVEVHINDYLDIICPHYTHGEVSSHAAERYVLYMVEKDDYEVCKPHSFDQLRWECSRPFAPHAPEKFSEKFQRFTPFTLGKEFRQGESYYYISKPMHHHGQECLRLKVDVVGHKGSGKNQPDKSKAEDTGKSLDAGKVPFPAAGGVHNPSNRLPADDPAAIEPNVLRSVGSSGAQLVSLSLFFTMIPVLLGLFLLN